MVWKGPEGRNQPAQALGMGSGWTEGQADSHGWDKAQLKEKMAKPANTLAMNINLEESSGCLGSNRLPMPMVNMKTDIKIMKLRGMSGCLLFTRTRAPMARQMPPPIVRDQSRSREPEVSEWGDMMVRLKEEASVDGSCAFAFSSVLAPK
jgi:hypothetical protein